MPDIDKVDALLEKATVDCYSEEEAFWGVFYSLDEGLNFPLQASALGDYTQLILGFLVLAAMLIDTLKLQIRQRLA